MCRFIIRPELDAFNVSIVKVGTSKVQHYTDRKEHIKSELCREMVIAVILCEIPSLVYLDDLQPRSSHFWNVYAVIGENKCGLSTFACLARVTNQVTAYRSGLQSWHEERLALATRKFSVAPFSLVLTMAESISLEETKYVYQSSSKFRQCSNKVSLQ